MSRIRQNPARDCIPSIDFPGEDQKGRPEPYSKQLALSSFIAALDGAPDGDRIFVNDGVVPTERRQLMAGVGQVITLPGLGNRLSYRACLGIVETSEWSDDDIVYLVEDDYLHVPGALCHLGSAAEKLPTIEYFTLYDSPDYYSLTRHRAFMRARTSRFQLPDVEWRIVRSTCLTYGARVGSLKGDSWVHYLCSRANPPADYAIWAILSGWGLTCAVPRALKPNVRPHSRALVKAWAAVPARPSRRELYVSRPALAAHMHPGLMGPGVNWKQVAQTVAA